MSQFTGFCFWQKIVYVEKNDTYQVCLRWIYSLRKHCHFIIWYVLLMQSFDAISILQLWDFLWIFDMNKRQKRVGRIPTQQNIWCPMNGWQCPLKSLLSKIDLDQSKPIGPPTVDKNRRNYNFLFKYILNWPAELQNYLRRESWGNSTCVFH